MTVAPEATAADVVIGQPERSDATGHRFGKLSAASAARVVATAVLWMMVLAIITSV